MTDTDTTRYHLGELAAMAAQNEAMERKILARAEDLLKDVEAKIPAAKAASLVDPERYTSLIEERGRLQQIIERARAVLG